TRPHSPSYHRPLLLSSRSARAALLSWFGTVAEARDMPWRRPFRPPSALSRAELARRAYEVWISEVMLQQTRVRTVVAYWSRWMARWPTVRDLAAASEADVLAAWQGLGYYSRARRVLQAARAVCAADPDGLLPGTVDRLMALPGLGRYTAGAVAAIVFGVPAPMVDGNVLRVLSRQMGLLADVKGDKRVVDMLWRAAEELMEAVAADGDEVGAHGQALMELGSTVCASKPNCAACPITSTCRAYSEGVALAETGRCAIEGEAVLEDVEDLCAICAPFDEAVGGEDEEAAEDWRPPPSSPGNGDGKLSRFFAGKEEKRGPKSPAGGRGQGGLDPRTLTSAVNHARKFPLRKPKKKVPLEDILVCAIRRVSDGRFLIHQRPDKGLLAGLWELPSHPLLDKRTPKTRRTEAVEYVTELLGNRDKAVKHVAELGIVPWLFSHLKLHMHVHLFEVEDIDPLSGQGTRARWATTSEIDAESMGTGMKKCWSLVKER
ncbi:DNA glycosylase-like protein, partial [Thermothelomyces thermophilus ATCC 42464]